MVDILEFEKSLRSSGKIQEIAKPILQKTLEDGLIPSVDIVAIPKDFRLESLKPFIEENLPKPPRRKGESHHATIQSFITHAARYKCADTVLFADSKSEKVTAIYNYNPEGEDNTIALHGDHRAVLDLEKSTELKEWIGVSSQPLDPTALAFFLEKRGIDLISEKDAPEKHAERLGRIKQTGGIIGSPTDVINTIPVLKILETSTVQKAVNISSGECNLIYKTEHQTTSPEGETIIVPGWFLIAIPIFKKGPVDLIPVRLRYQKKERQIVWSIDLIDVDTYIDESYEQVLTDLANALELPAFNGSPE